MVSQAIDSEQFHFTLGHLVYIFLQHLQKVTVASSYQSILANLDEVSFAVSLLYTVELKTVLQIKTVMLLFICLSEMAVC